MKKSLRLFRGGGILMVLAAFSAPTASAIETVRVDPANGAPRLLVDGKPVRARIFFGNPGARPQDLGKITPEGRRVSFDFSPQEDAPGNGTMHWRFGEIPGEVCLDDIHIVDLDTGEDAIPACSFEGGQGDFTKDWMAWPTGAANTVGTVRVEPGKGADGSSGLRVSLQAPPNGVWPDFHVGHLPSLVFQKSHHYRVTFWARAEPARSLTIGFYRPGKPYVALGPNVFPQQIQLAAAAGVNFVSYSLPLYWPKPGAEADWTAVDASCQRVLDANAQALLLPRIAVYAPEWWLREHPGEAMVWDKPGDQQPMANVASPLFRQEAVKNLTALIAHLEEKFGKQMAGYHMAGQNTDEWFYYESWLPALNGYAEADARAWQGWLKARYGDNAHLRAAWHDPAADLASVAVPSPAARRAAPAGVLRDPVAERPVLDFGEFQQEMMTGCITDLAHAARQASHGRKLVLFFYGYGFEFGAVHTGPAVTGHYALRRILDCPDIDVLCSPISYFDRGLGGNAPAMSAAESVALAGKMWLHEDDTSTYLTVSTAPGARDHVDTVEQTNQELVRNVAQCALRNFGTWWMDLGATGWFNDPRLWAEMARLKALDQPLLDHPTPFHPEVAAVLDEQSMLRVAYGGNSVTDPGISKARQALGRMGCPYGQYLLDDVTAGKVSAKLYVFLDAWRLSPEQRRSLLDKTRGAARIWCYAPGYQEGDHASLEAMGALTGFRIQKITGVPAQAQPTAIGASLGLTGPFGVKQHIEPLFAAQDATPQETLATYPDGSAAIAMRHTANGISLFVGPPGLTPELLRLAASQSKAHLFTRTNCNVYASGPFLVLHGAQEGPLEIDTGSSAPILDVLTGQEVGKGPRWQVPLGKGETRVLKIAAP